MFIFFIFAIPIQYYTEGKTLEIHKTNFTKYSEGFSIFNNKKKKEEKIWKKYKSYQYPIFTCI